MDADRRFREGPQGGHHRKAQWSPGGRPIVIGLTGSMGAGKTSVARLLGELGAHVIDADVVARQVVEPGMPAIAEIRAAFGDAVLNPDGSLSRQRLADAVFSDPGLLRRLESIIHPRVLDHVREQIALRSPGDVVVVDAPLLIESGYHCEVDQVWVVVAPEEVRISRVIERGGITRCEAGRRMRSQLSQEEKAALADVVIDNGGSWPDTEKQVRREWDEVWRRDL